MNRLLIDRPARNRLADALRALASGLISNDEFEDARLPYSKTDAAIREVFSKGAWTLYSDLCKYRLTGEYQLDDASRAAVARWVLFLKTDLPYEWPVSSRPQRIGMLVTNLLTLGTANRLFAARFRARGDIDVWPFIKQSDYEAALHHPPYLR